MNGFFFNGYEMDTTCTHRKKSSSLVREWAGDVTEMNLVEIISDVVLDLINTNNII